MRRAGTTLLETMIALVILGMELAQLDLPGMLSRNTETLEGGFQRRVELRGQGRGLSEVAVTVIFPGGGRFEVRRLVAP